MSQDEDKRGLIESIDFSRIQFFHGLSKANLEKLKPRLEIEQFKSGDLLFSEGEPGDYLYIIVDGRVKVFVEKGKGGIREIARVGPYETVGEMALLSGAPRSASIKAISDLTVLKLSKNQLDEVLIQNKYLAIHFAGLLAKRLASTRYEVYEPKLSPKEVHARMTQSGVSKAVTKAWQLFFLALLAGIYISIGGHAYLVAVEQGMGKIIAGTVFGVGLILVVIAEAELFTGNIIMMVGLLSSLYHFKKVVKNLMVVYVGNLIGSLLFALVIFETGLFGSGAEISSIGQVAVKVSEAKLGLSFGECFVRGIFCNMLVILAIIMAIFAKDIISKIFCCVLPVMVFVASGFEHCVANMYLIPIGLLTKGVPVSELSIMFKNILPVTLGNIVGGLFIIFIHPVRIERILQKFSRLRPAFNRVESV